jgi:formiminoglutamate deiminase
MYAAAAVLDPDAYRSVAALVFGEMVRAGYTAVGEFHYLHHRPDGAAYPYHEMEMALVDAARQVGLRLVLLDTCYLTGGIGRELTGVQRRFGDATAEAWLTRWHALGEALRALDAGAGEAGGLVTLGGAVHSVRAVPPEDLAWIAENFPADPPLHLHLSEQPDENEACRRAYGLTPTALADKTGLLTPRLAAVHATHLDPADIALLGRSGASAVLCPTTEADLGDGIGPARALADAGMRLAMGSDQQARVDPFVELRALEASQRLALGRRGVLTPAELWDTGQVNGYRALGLAPPLSLGGPCDFLELDPDSPRTWGADPAQMLFAATGEDVVRTVVAGRIVAGEP